MYIDAVAVSCFWTIVYNGKTGRSVIYDARYDCHSGRYVCHWGLDPESSCLCERSEAISYWIKRLLRHCVPRKDTMSDRLLRENDDLGAGMTKKRPTGLINQTPTGYVCRTNQPLIPSLQVGGKLADEGVFQHFITLILYHFLTVINEMVEKNSMTIGDQQVEPSAAAHDKLLVDVRGLKTHFHTEAGTAKAVDGVDFNVRRGEVLGIVGESGSGKSVTALSIVRLIPNPPGEILAGEIFFQGRDLLKVPLEEMYKIRGRDIAMIFQEPMTSLNPVFTIGKQVQEILKHHHYVEHDKILDYAVEMLDNVGIPDAAKRMKDYPHQFSGGMRQRVMIAMAMACDPALLIADEPTTALDVTIQAQILDLMMQHKEQRPGAAIILITHDLAVIAETCQRVIVMYGGMIQEIADVNPLFEEPLHPYTQGLLKSLPRPDIQKQHRLYNIPGTVPSIIDLPPGCKFSNRCDQAIAICSREEPRMREVRPGRKVRCHLFS
ncbi:MAG: ABC transporter ATP-binding protein [Candidatus Electryoneaceae bacterium]|nr:ABC transporter ATP-binding protein [Candidatus Electryoneaceae bacterium]